MKNKGTEILKFKLSLKNPRKNESELFGCLSKSFLDNVYKFIDEKIEDLSEEEKENLSDDCTLVWWGCGSCPGFPGGPDAGRLDIYCDSSGGSEPDHTGCLPC